MAARHVTIGPEFFAKSRNDYDNWKWALIREFCQNSIDCGSSLIKITTVLDKDGNTVLTVENDGEPMDYNTITDKLFCLGSSGKDFVDSVGGFGKAKELLYFCHESYTIRSGNYIVEGSGADYDITESDTHLHGTTSRIVIAGDYCDLLADNAYRFVSYSQVSCKFVINNDTHVSCKLKKGYYRRDLGFGKVYTNNSFNRKLIIRINGIPMFDYPTGIDKCVVVELDGNSSDTLTSNRDGLINPYKTQLSDFLTELTVDKQSALKNRVPRYVRYKGDKLSITIDADTLDLPELANNTTNVIDGKKMISLPVSPVMQAASSTEYSGSSAPSYTSSTSTAHETISIGTDFIIKNETDLKIPKHFDPGSGYFSSYSSKLIKVWGRLLLQMHKLFAHGDSFSVGFIFDDGDIAVTEAEYEQSSDFGKVYYLNPAVVVEQNYSYSKSFKKRFKLTERDRLIAIAAHEFVHGLGYGWHDERYANKLTSVLATVMKNRKAFGWCFQ